jgi:hypothetical protein
LKSFKLIKRTFLSQKPTKFLIDDHSEEFEVEVDEDYEAQSQLDDNKDNYNIDEVFGKAEEDIEKNYKQALKNEELLWHNNVDLPYQKKLNRK